MRTSATDFENGWLDVGFFPGSVTGAVHTLPNNDTIVTDIFANFTENAATYVGLPVVGFAVQSFTNGVLIVNGQATLSDYGGNFIQKGTRFIDSIVPAPLAKKARQR